MTDELTRGVVQALADRFGLTVAKTRDDRAFSLLFTDEKANRTTFRMVLSSLLADHDVTRQFSPSDSSIPGVYARGVTLPGSVTPIYLVVVGDEDAAQYVPLPTTTRLRS